MQGKATEGTDWNLTNGHGYILNRDRGHSAAALLNLQFYLWKSALDFNIHPSTKALAPQRRCHRRPWPRGAPSGSQTSLGSCRKRSWTASTTTSASPSTSNGSPLKVHVRRLSILQGTSEVSWLGLLALVLRIIEAGPKETRSMTLGLASKAIKPSGILGLVSTVCVEAFPPQRNGQPEGGSGGPNRL
ncbi:hypothetical protein LY76DRAFT_519144 [Colletotrichum caudatum]|nr:hypothetical protein LY76DRAFT_519144 [Colletotrichum caudatum]